MLGFFILVLFTFYKQCLQNLKTFGAKVLIIFPLCSAEIK